MAKKIQIKFLGTSSGQPIPRPDCNCLQCQSKDKKDKRLRSAILIEKKILVDAGPDILNQLTKFEIENLDSVLVTHEHDDHIGGLKYLLKIKPNLRIIRMQPGQHFKLLGVDFFAFKIPHSKIAVTIGLEIGEQVVYIPDSASLEIAMKYLQEVKVAILDGSVLDHSMSGHMAMKEIIAITMPLSNIKKIYFTHNGHTQIPQKTLTEIIRQMGDRRFALSYDSQEILI